MLLGIFIVLYIVAMITVEPLRLFVRGNSVLCHLLMFFIGFFLVAIDPVLQRKR